MWKIFSKNKGKIIIIGIWFFVSVNPLMAAGTSFGHDSRISLSDSVVLSLADYTVTTTSDETSDEVCDTDCSFRDAVYEANHDISQDHVIYLPAGTYELNSAITIDNSSVKITVQGVGADNTIIDAMSDYRIGFGLDISSDSEVEVNDLAIINASYYGLVARENANVEVNDSKFYGSDSGVVNIFGYMELNNIEAYGNSYGGLLNCGHTIVNDSSFFANQFGISSLRSSENLSYVPILELNNSLVSNNQYDGLFIDSYATITGTTIDSNGFSGIYFANYTLEVFDTEISNNQASGIFYVNGEVTVDNSIISGNQNGATDHSVLTALGGGGIFGTGGETIVSRTTISDNISDNKGGGIYVTSSGVLSISESIIENNIAIGEGGGIYATAQIYWREVNIDKSLITGNYSSSGSAIYANEFSFFDIKNSTISGNEISAINESETGAIHNNGGVVALSFSTISGNILGRQDSFGIFSEGSASIIIAKGSIISDNKYQIGRITQSNSCAGRYTSYGYNVTDDRDCLMSPSDIFISSPGLESLADNGGQTETIALIGGSQAINLVPVAECTDIIYDIAITEDQRGFGRPFGSKCDAGAFEFRTSTLGGTTGR